MNSTKAGELRLPGHIRTIEGTVLDLENYKPEDVNIRDLAWGTGRTLRYGGHLREDHTVAHHSIIMSYCVPEEYALEALLHDAAEALIGDIIWPVKVLFPEIAEFESALLNVIMTAFEVKTGEGTQDRDGIVRWKLSPIIKEFDLRLFEHECFSIGRPGIYHQDIEDAWMKAAEVHMEYWWAPQYAFMQRFRELTGVENPHELDLKEFTAAWFPGESLSEEDNEALDAIMGKVNINLEEQAK